MAASKIASTEIAHDRVESIMLKTMPNGVGGQWLQVEIAYQAADSSETKTVLLGLQLTVQPFNLLNALAYWKAATNDHPNELLDRIERLLRGHSMAGV